MVNDLNNVKMHFQQQLQLDRQKSAIVINYNLQIFNNRMQIDQLTPNGIERLFKGETVLLQLLNPSISNVVKPNGAIEMVTANVSDGFAYHVSVFIFLGNFSNRNIEFNVVKMRLMDSVIAKLAKGADFGTKPMLVDSAIFQVITNKIGYMIGNPISYEQYLKNGKKNPKGSRKIYGAKQENNQQDTQDDLLQQQLKLKQKLQAAKTKQQQKQKPKKQQQNRTSGSNRNNSVPNQGQGQKLKQAQLSNYNTGNNAGNKNNNSNPSSNANTNKNNNNNKNNSNSNSHSHSVDLHTNYKPPKQNTKPISRTGEQSNNQNSRRSIKPQVKHHQSAHQNISQLFFGMENFSIQARLLFIWPVKAYTNKKGNRSQLINLQFGDETGTIMCTVFGQSANRFQSLVIDKVYSITGAAVVQSNYKGVKEIKLTFNDSTAVNCIQKYVETNKIPGVEKFCLSVKQLVETETGKIVSVICMVKQGQLIEFVSKNGNNIKKKTLKMYDLDNQIQCDLTLFNDNATMEYPKGMYALKGVEVDQFQGKKQFKGSLTFLARQLKNHPMNKKINQIDQLTFTCVGSNQKSKKQIISSFTALNQKCEELNLGQNLWSETICYVKSLRLGGNSKNIYLSCPFCKKKILQQSATDCVHCKKQFQRPKYRYILQVNLIDNHDNIWVGAYDDIGQRLLALPDQLLFSADAFAEMSEDALRVRVHQLRYKQIKAKIVSAKQQYNGDLKVKHKIVKLLDIHLQDQCKNLLQKIRSTIQGI